MQDRVLVYTCCDKKYAEFIPIFCAALLSTNSNVDIEIGTSLTCLSPSQSQAIDNLLTLHPDASILIKLGFFKEEDGCALLNDASVVEFNTVRFVTNPQIQDKYTYISDIDIISLDCNFALSHIAEMNRNNRSYSNIVRKGTKRLSGLHFCLSESMYPLDLMGVDISGVDEEVLYQIVQKKSYIDTKSTFRPVHGIHMSPNRVSVRGRVDSPGWFPVEWNYCEDKDNYKKKWYNFTHTPEYECVLDSIRESSIISAQITKLENYYERRPFAPLSMEIERFCDKHFPLCISAGRRLINAFITHFSFAKNQSVSPSQ